MRRAGRRLLVLAAAASGPLAAGAIPVQAVDAPEVGDRMLQLRVVDQTFGVTAGETFTATIELAGEADDLSAVGDLVAPSPTADPPRAVAEVVMTAHDRVTDRERLTELDEQGPTGTVDTAVLPATDVFATAGATSGQISVPVDLGQSAAGLMLGDPGIYPLTVDLVVDTETVASAMTFIELIDAEEAVGIQPLAVSIVAGVDDPGPWPSATELSSASIEVARLIELSELVDGPLNIALPPGLVTMLSMSSLQPDQTDDLAPTTEVVPETSAPATTEQTGTTMLGGTPGTTQPAFLGIETPDALADAFRADEIFAVPAVALDPSSIVAVNQADLFTGQLRIGEDVLSSASPRAVISRSVWLSRDAVSAGAMRTLRNLGIRMLVLPDEAANSLGVPTDASASGVFAVSMGADGSLPGMSFSPLGAQLQSPIGSDSTPAATNELAVRLLVELQLQRVASSTPAILLATPRITVPDPQITAQFVDLAAAMPDISIVPISRLPGVVDRALSAGQVTPVILPAAAGDDLSARLERVAAARIEASHAAGMLVDSDRTAEWRDELDQAMSTAVDDATAFGHLSETQAEIDRVLHAIVPPDSDTFRLTGTSSRLRLRIENTYDEPLNVVVHVRSPKLRFPEPDPLVTVPAGESLLVEIPVEARSNGTFTIEVDVLAPDRAPLSQPVILKARVSRITGLSQVVTGAAVLVLVSWWYSHFRRSRRSRFGLADLVGDHGAVPLIAVSPDAAEALARPPALPESADRPDAESERDGGG